MTIEQVLERIEKEINESYSSQIWAENLYGLIDVIRKEITEEESND